MRTVLVVDDEPEKSLPLVDYVRKQGYTVLFASGGREALAVLEAQRPDMVICDLEMPDKGGYAVLEATATSLGMPGLPFMLAHEEWTMENWSKSAGGRTADCHLWKPFVFRDVVAFLGRLSDTLDARGVPHGEAGTASWP